MRSSEMIKHFSERWVSVERWMAIGGAFLLYGMVGLICLEIFLRKSVNICIPTVIEISEFLMVVLVYLSIAYAQAVKANIRMDFVVNRLRPSLRTMLELISLVLAALLFAFITWQGFLHFWSDLVLGETTYGRPALLTWPHKLFIPVGSAFLVFRFILDIIVIGAVSELKKGDGEHAQQA